MYRLKLVLFILALCSFLAANAEMGDTVKVMHLYDYKPYSSVDENGNSTGLLIDLWNLWATKVEKVVIFESGTLDHCLSKVVANEADAVAGLFAGEDIARHITVWRSDHQASNGIIPEERAATKSRSRPLRTQLAFLLQLFHSNLSGPGTPIFR